MKLVSVDLKAVIYNPEATVELGENSHQPHTQLDFPSLGVGRQTMPQSTLLDSTELERRQLTGEYVWCFSGVRIKFSIL